jgi:hypothetical protein
MGKLHAIGFGTDCVGKTCHIRHCGICTLGRAHMGAGQLEAGQHGHDLVRSGSHTA